MTDFVVFGPVPSRRLGRSLGINNIPPKKCSYSCIYCQLGLTSELRVRRRAFYEPMRLAQSVSERVKQTKEKGEIIDYLAFVPDGEPTLDINLGKEIGALQALDIKIAVITNGSLLWDESVRQDLFKADWVCLKVDAVSPGIWHSVNRPHKHLKLDVVFDGMIRFAQDFRGQLTSETMLIDGVNDDGNEIGKIAYFLTKLQPVKAYIAVPTRPPAVPVKAAGKSSLKIAYQVFGSRLSQVELLTGYEGNNFTSGGNSADDLLSITSVHPMREDAVVKVLSHTDMGWESMDKLINNGTIVERQYRGKKFYARNHVKKTHTI